MFTAAKTVERLKRLLAENEALEAKISALEAKISALEGSRGKQWENLLNFDGRPQRDNLGEGKP